jgi:hypothetical protein
VGTNGSGGSGSENWETFDEEGGSVEPDNMIRHRTALQQQQQYYARVPGKRLSDGGMSQVAGKKLRGHGGNGKGIMVVQGEGSEEAGWTDESY